jgi:hypothetical protein
MSTTAGTDVEQVEAAATDYLRSFYEGTSEERAARMERILHPELAKRSPSSFQEEGTFRAWEVSEMLEIAAGSVNEVHSRPYRVRVLDVYGDIASVRTDANWGVDYMHLGRIDGEWRVINVLWDD